MSLGVAQSAMQKRRARRERLEFIGWTIAGILVALLGLGIWFAIAAPIVMVLWHFAFWLCGLT